MSADQRIAELGLVLPPAPKPAGVYMPALEVDGLLYVSGHGPLQPDGKLILGKVMTDADLEAGKAAARQVGLTMLATLRAALGSLDRIERLVKTLGLVNAGPDFTNHPLVINGFSELMVDVFGPDNGRGARSAVGAVSLPVGMMVEVEAVFKLR